MSIAGILVGVALVTIVLIVLALPFVRRAAHVPKADETLVRQQDRVVAYYERVLQNIHDLDEDHALGKINDADYARDRERWAQRGAQALQVLDNLKAAPLQGDTTSDLDEEIEAMVAQARSPQPAAE